MNLYISDLHFGHTNVIKHDERPFASIEEMDRMLIELWNARVGNEDHVYIIGDFCYKSGKQEQWYLKQLRGHKHLILGNHDDKLLGNEEAMSFFDSIDKMARIKDGDEDVVLCHYPLASWDKERYGAWHVYGHIHAVRREERQSVAEYMKDKPRALNAGCMINNYMPVSLKELVENNERFWTIYEGEMQEES